MKTRRYRITQYMHDGSQGRHHACRSMEKALEWWAKYRKNVVPDGQSGLRRLVLHQGNLMRGYSFKILQQTSEPWTRADDLTAKHTAFETFSELLDAPGYFPSLQNAELADLYDAAQAARGNSRRAFRFGDAEIGVPQ